MEPPKPKTPMIAKNDEFGIITITTASLDARQWIENYGPQVGKLMPDLIYQGGILFRFDLAVAEVFDADEVCAYINSMADLFR